MSADDATSPPDEQLARALEILATTFGRVEDVVVHQTWGPTLVVEAAVRDAPTRVVLKASVAHDVFAETAAARLALDAGVPVPSILAHGRDGSILGGRWFVMERAAGRTWESLYGCRLDFSVLLRDLGALLRRLHAIRPSGYGSLDTRGEGKFVSWRAWIDHIVASALRRIDGAGFDTSELVELVERALAEVGPELERRSASLVHGDLGDREVIVDPRSLRVTAIVDWGDALVAIRSTSSHASWLAGRPTIHGPRSSGRFCTTSTGANRPTSRPAACRPSTTRTTRSETRRGVRARSRRGSQA